MSPELEESAFRRLLEVEAARERTLVQRLARPEAVAAQALSLAQTQWERGLRELPGAIAAGDFDEPYLNIYRSIISGCKGLLAAYGYRIQGGDGAHFETLRLATMELVAWNREAGTLLESIREPIRSARNEAEYQRPGVTTEAELRQLFAAAAEILADFVSEVDRLIGPLSLSGSTRGTSRTSEEWRVAMPGKPVPPSIAGASAQSAGQATSDSSQPETDSVPPAVRVQLLATEHWSLLATRSTAQSEVLSRITTFLMLVSSSIVGLALIGQVTRFDGRFTTFALVLIGALVVIGTLAQMRVGNASLEDLAHVIGMNRLRAAYVELDPAIERYLVTSRHDDHKGVWQTYNHLVGPNQISNVLASSGTFITFVTSGLTAAFAALIAVAFNAPGPIVGGAAAAGGLSFLATALVLGMWQYRRIRGRSVLFPAAGAESYRDSEA